MIRNIKKIFNIASVITLGSLVLYSCDSDIDNLGEQFFTGTEGVDAKYDLIAYNFNNNDSIRSDGAKLDSVVLGVFSEPQFGMQKSEFVSQVRLSSYDPDFGDNPVLDSAVLVIKPAFSSDSITTTTTEDYTYNDPDNANIAAKKVVNTYPVKKYGKTKIGGKTILNLKIFSVADFLGTQDYIYSNKTVNTSSLLGSKAFNGSVSSIKITKDTDGRELYNREAGIRIPLDSAFFQNNILLKEDSPELSDASNFTRFFKGIKVAVEENDGYFMKYAVNGLELNLYYKSSTTTDGTTTRKNKVFQLNPGATNIQFSQITFDRSGTPFQTDMAASSSVTGDPRLYLQGMGGPGAGLKIPADVISELKSKFDNDKIGIIGAKIRLYTHPDSWNTTFRKPENFVVRERKFDTAGNPTDLYSFLTDMDVLANSGYYQLVRAYDLKKTPAKYDISITQSLKNIIEKNADVTDFIINVGSYTIDLSSSQALRLKFGNNYNTRVYTPNRAVFVGTVTNTADPNYDKGVKLLVTYGQK